MLEKILKVKSSGIASKESIAENEEMLSILYSLVHSAENIPVGSESKSLKEILNERFQSGRDSVFKEWENSTLGTRPNKYFDREKFRAYHEANVREIEPNLF